MKLVGLEKVQLEDGQPLAAGTTADWHSNVSNRDPKDKCGRTIRTEN